MRRALPTIPINMKVYRHFAVLTVVITLSLAMFANGENRKMIENKIQKQQMHDKMAQMQVEELGVTRTMNAAQHKDSGWGPDPAAPKTQDSPSSFGQSTSVAAARPVNSSAKPGCPSVALSRPGFRPAASAANAANCTNRSRLVTGGSISSNAAAAMPLHMSEDQLNAMIQASRERSGGTAQ